MTIPSDPTVAELVDLLDDNLREMFEERAAIREHEGGHIRAHAEALAMLDVLERFPEALSGVTVFWIEIDGQPHWVVTTRAGRDVAEEHIEKIGATKKGVVDVAFVVEEDFGGVARITAAA